MHQRKRKTSNLKRQITMDIPSFDRQAIIDYRILNTQYCLKSQILNFPDRQLYFPGFLKTGLFNAFPQ
ncbi:MAG: hypothetical protein JXB24_08540 [Bacteroidales bacterium]|nr:hypothetical protein [Bacteroidales bacterium]